MKGSLKFALYEGSTLYKHGIGEKFRDSALSLRSLRTLTTTGLLMAMAIALRSVGIDVTPDLRIVFTYIPLCIIGMLYGPVVCGMSVFAVDIIGYIVANRSPRGYMPQLIPVEILTGVIYGLILYKQVLRPHGSDILRAAAARLGSVVVCNICLRSVILYVSFTNPDFSLMCFVNGNTAMRDAFLLWVSPRVMKNIVQYFIDVPLLAAALPAAQTAYGLAGGKRRING